MSWAREVKEAPLLYSPSSLLECEDECCAVKEEISKERWNNSEKRYMNFYDFLKLVLETVTKKKKKKGMDKLKDKNTARPNIPLLLYTSYMRRRSL